MHPTPGTVPADPGHHGDAEPPGADDLPPAARRAGHGRGPQVVRTIGFHVVALACFTVPAAVLWWHVWSGHPSAVLTCGCGDPAQEVWFVAWPAWAIAHLHSPVFSGAVNVPDGANLLSNTSGTLVGIVLAPVTWVFGPVAATNAALTLAPALSAWACFAAIRPLVTWKAGAVPAALVYGYSAAIVTSLTFGHVSVSVLVIPPFLFTTLHEIVIRQEHTVRRDGLLLAALVVVQFFLSPEILVMCVVLAVVGLLAVMAVGWRQLRGRAGHALPALALGGGVSLALLAYPTWYGLAGPQAVSGVLFALAPISGVPLSGFLAPGAYGARAPEYIRFGGYLGRMGPPPDYIGGGVALAALGSVVIGRRRPLTWLLVFLAAVVFSLALGGYLLGAPSWLGHPWLPWRDLWRLPVLKEILPFQFEPLFTLFVAFVIAVGLDALHGAPRRRGSWLRSHRTAVTSAATAVVAVIAFVPVFVTFEAPLRVVGVHNPVYLRPGEPVLAADTVVLTIPFAVSGSAQPMLWQAVDGMRFRLAGAALKTPDARGRAGRVGTPGIGPADPDQPDDSRWAAPRWDLGPAHRRPPRPARLAGGPGRHRRPQPGPGLRLRVLHRGARRGARLRARGLGLEAAVGGSRRARRARRARRDWDLVGALPELRGRAGGAPRAAGHGALRPVRGRRRLSPSRRAVLGLTRCSPSSTSRSRSGTSTRHASSTCTRSAASPHAPAPVSPMCGSTACSSRCRTVPTKWRRRRGVARATSA